MKNVQDKKLSSIDMIKLATSILVIEFETPRLQQDIDARSAIIRNVLSLLFKKYYTPKIAMAILADIFVHLAQENPELLDQDESANLEGYVT